MANISGFLFPDNLNEFITSSLTSILKKSSFLAKELLSSYSNQSNSLNSLNIAFGNNTDTDRFFTEWRTGNIYFPTIEVVTASTINGANGAYARETNKIYLAQEFLLTHQQEIDVIAAVLLEEYGHYLDSELNPVDSHGDEGAIFSALVRGEELIESELQQLKNEDDRAVVIIDDKKILVEQNSAQILTDIIQITDNDDDDYLPQLSGNIIFWYSYSGAFFINYPKDLNDNISKIKTVSHPPNNLSGSVSGDKLVYNTSIRLAQTTILETQPSIPFLSGIYSVDINSNTRIEILSALPPSAISPSGIVDYSQILNKYESPSISGDNVAFASSNYSANPDRITNYFDYDGIHENDKLEILNLATNSRRTIKTTTDQYFVGFSVFKDIEISGENIIWRERGTNNDGVIFLYDGDSDTIEQITNNSDRDSIPSISGNNVVWEQSDEIFLYDGNKTIQLTNNNINDSNPSVSGNNVVWAGSGEIFLYSIESGVTFQLTDNTVDDSDPDISGNRIAWRQFDGNDYEILTAILPSFKVNTTGDDSALDKSVSPDSSEDDGLQITLRSLIEYANANDDFNEIKFDIPEDDPNYKNEIWKIDIGNSLKIENEDIVIDAEGQKIEVTGGSASGFIIDANNVIIRDLTINNFGGNGIWIRNGDSATIINNKIGTDVTGELDKGNNLLGIFIEPSSDNNTVQGGNLIQDNVISGNGNSGVGMTGNKSTNNQVLSNFIGTNADGTKSIPNDQNGVSISDLGANVIQGNTIGSNKRYGIEINTSTDNVIRNNWIGTNQNGNTTIGNNFSGIFIKDSIKNTINNLIEDNTIANNVLDGIQLFNSSTNNIQKNLIGVYTNNINPGGEELPLGNKRHGILIEGDNSNNNKIGSRFIDPPNVIAYNESDGVFVNSGIGNNINRNLIYENGQLGIDLGNNGINENQLDDFDTGANNLQNPPSIFLVGEQEDDNGNKFNNFALNLNSTPNTNFFLELFKDKGKELFQEITITTNEIGTKTIELLVPSDIEDITVTATDLTTNDTSEFTQVQKVNFNKKVYRLEESDDKNTIFNIARTGENLSNAISANIIAIPFEEVVRQKLSTLVDISDGISAGLFALGVIDKILDRYLKSVNKNLPQKNQVKPKISNIIKRVIIVFDAVNDGIKGASLDDKKLTDISTSFALPPNEPAYSFFLNKEEDILKEGKKAFGLKVISPDETKTTISQFSPLVVAEDDDVDRFNVVYENDDIKDILNRVKDGATLGATIGAPGGLIGSIIFGAIGALGGAIVGIAIEELQDIFTDYIIEWVADNLDESDRPTPPTKLALTEESETIESTNNPDVYEGNLAQFNGDTIPNFNSDDLIELNDVSLTNENVNITFGSAILDIDEDLDGVVDSTITLEGDFTNAEFLIEPLSIEDFNSTFITVEFPEIFVDDASITEGNNDSQNLTFTVSLSREAEETITVDYATSDDTAVADEDYLAISGTLEFAPGETEKTITVEVIGDTDIEEDETFLVNLSNVIGGEIADSQGIGTITNDDLNPETPTVKEALNIDGNNTLQTYDYTLINLYGSIGNNPAIFDSLLQQYSDILLGEGATRTTGESITNYLNSIADSVFDIDGNGAVQTSDYTLISLYGSIGNNPAIFDSLIQQNSDVLLGEDATRTTGIAIVDYFTQS